MNVLITGAQFGNKGAQSMLFTVVNEVRDRYPNADFFYLPLDYYKEECFQNLESYRFHFVIDDKAGQDFPTRFGAPQMAFRNANIRKILRNAQRHGEVLALSKLWDKLDVLIDVSGYSLTSKFGISSINRVLRMIQTAKAHGVKTILMPQSYGPFDFPEDVCKRIGASLKEVDLLFAREPDGVAQLQEHCGVTNAILSPDIVIQAKDIDWRNLFVHEPKLTYPKVSTSGNVGIVPNGETIKNGRKDVILNCYRQILQELREGGKEVYIFRHSDDLALCREIYEMVKDDAHCHLIEDEMDCLSYSAFVQQLDFVIASRFHSIVNAYRVSVPALVLGWAIKYQELTKLVGQEQYVFDVSTLDQPDHAGQMLRQLRAMMENHAAESSVIKTHVQKVQQESCFLECWKVLES